MVPFVLTIIITKIVTKNITKFSIMVEKCTPLRYYAKFCFHILRKSDFLLFHTGKTFKTHFPDYKVDHF